MSERRRPIVPPVALEAERAILGNFLLDPQLIPSYLDTLRPEWFYKEATRDIWRAMQALVRAGEPVDVLTLSAELTRRGQFTAVGGHAFLVVLEEEATVATHLPAYVGLVREAFGKRELLALGIRLQQAAENGNGLGALEALVTGTQHDLATLQPPRRPDPMGVGGGDFVRQPFPGQEVLVEDLLFGDGGGWVAGEEKLAKSYFCLEEAVSLALGVPVCGRFAVPARQRVLFIEEEDSPRRLHTRLCALLRGKGVEPDDPDVRADLNDWLWVAPWVGFSFDEPAMVARLEATCQVFQPRVIYVDVLRKVTSRDLNNGAEVRGLLATLDHFRRTYQVVWRILHHFRKIQGFRAGRGSQELGGSYQLGAWAETSLFFEPLGRHRATIRIDRQSKDAADTVGFQLVFESEGPMHAPAVVRLRAEPLVDASRRGRSREAVLQALATLPSDPGQQGGVGVSVAALVTATRVSRNTVRSILKDLAAEGLAEVTDRGPRGVGLWTLSAGYQEPIGIHVSI
jgi:hypothetical protein